MNIKNFLIIFVALIVLLLVSAYIPKDALDGSPYPAPEVTVTVDNNDPYPPPEREPTATQKPDKDDDPDPYPSPPGTGVPIPTEAAPTDEYRPTSAPDDDE